MSHAPAEHTGEIVRTSQKIVMPWRTEPSRSLARHERIQRNSEQISTITATLRRSVGNAGFPDARSTHEGESTVLARIALTCCVALAWVIAAAGQSRQPTRLKDGQPDIQGYYEILDVGGSGGLNIEPLVVPWLKNRASPGIVKDPPDGLIPYLPWARARRDEVMNNQEHPTPGVVDTRTRGWPDGTPRINFYYINPFQILQTAGAVVFLYEAQHEFRYVPVDGKPHVDPGVKLWMGSSRGRWEGTTLVIDVRNVYDRVRLSVQGDFHSDAVKITERWTWTSKDTITMTATFDDPKVYSRPWTAGTMMKRITEPGFELMEYSGVEGDRDQHLQVDIAGGKKKEQEKK
jgi:hypothetical protein